MRDQLFTFYCKAQQLSPTNKNRYDIIEQTHTHPYFEDYCKNKTKFNIGGYSFIYGVNNSKNPKGKETHPERKLLMALSSREGHMSGLNFQNINDYSLAVGDVKGTEDCIIFLHDIETKTIELFIAKGKAKDSSLIFMAVKSGNLDSDINLLRIQAKNVFKENENKKVTKSVTLLQTLLF